MSKLYIHDLLPEYELVYFHPNCVSHEAQAEILLRWIRRAFPCGVTIELEKKMIKESREGKAKTAAILAKYLNRGVD